MPTREYSKSLDCEVEFITIGSLRSDDVGDTIVVQDSQNSITRWLGFSIYEDLFKNFMSCEFTILDQDGFFLNRLRTEEVILIRFTTPNLKGYNFKTRTHYFYLYKVDPVVVLNKPAGAFYTIKGISFEYFYNSLRTFSRSYKGKTEDIAKSIYQEYLEPKSQKTVKKTFRTGRPTKNEMKFTFPYVNPIDAINHLASVSVDSQNHDVCNYVFFENKEGFNFTSITELIDTPRKVHKYTTTRTMSEPFTNYGAYFDKTIAVTPVKTSDKIIDTLDGVWGEYFAEFDLLYKSFKPFAAKQEGVAGGDVYGKRYLDYFPKTNHLNKKPLLSKENEVFKNPLGRNRVCFTNKALYSDEGADGSAQMFQTHEEEYSFQRRSMMQQINGFSVEMTVPGNSEITVGDIVELDTVIYRTSDKDKYLSGKYLVTAVHHLVTIKEYKTIVTISRDSLISDDFDDSTTAGA